MYRRILKPAFDALGAALGLIALSPLIVVVALSIRLRIGSPVLFRQRRIGLRDVPFLFLKFRTMTDEVDDSGHPLPDDLRLTRLGRFLRSTSLDELPQLWNVLKGDMSLVGPRPLLPEYLPRYSNEQRRRHEAKPGITGWAQVKGRNAISWEEKFKLDVWYVDHAGFLLDLRILWKTLVAVLCRTGISQRGHATMSPFLGSPSSGPD